MFGSRESRAVQSIANEMPWANFDTDTRPRNAMLIDPFDPFADLQVSTRVDRNAVMRGGSPTDPEGFLFTELRPDDRGGLDVLYPVIPEPGTGLLALAGLLGLGLGRRRR